MIFKKQYIKPEITIVVLDTSLVLMQPSNGKPRMPMASVESKGTDSPFASPFDDKPFS